MAATTIVYMTDTEYFRLALAAWRKTQPQREHNLNSMAVHEFSAVLQLAQAMKAEAKRAN